MTEPTPTKSNDVLESAKKEKTGFLSPQLSARIQGVLWLCLSAAFGTWASIQFNWITLVLAILTFIYGVLNLVRARVVDGHIVLSPQELDRYGSKLSEATPEILKLFEQKMRVREITKRMEKRFGLPPEVTLKYIIALGSYHGSS